MTNACELLRLKRSFACQGGVAETSVAEAEESLGLRFANDYRSYLKEMGSARFYGHELTGLNCPRYLNVVDATLAGREYYPSVPSGCYVIEEAQIDGITYWQDATGTVYEVVPNGKPIKRFSSFAQYIEATATTA